MTATTIHDWLRPHLLDLVREGAALGLDPHAVVATMIDLAESENFAVPPAPGTPTSGTPAPEAPAPEAPAPATPTPPRG